MYSRFVPVYATIESGDSLMKTRPTPFIKRAFDFIAALAGLILLSPLFGILSLLVRINIGKPVFFRQARPGKGEEIFYLRKFRSMREAFDADGNPLPDEQRLTRFGKLLRASSLDELPELWSVLKGEMSLVGPRPLLVKYLDRYNEEQHRRHEVLPGITGWAQVNGRNAISWEEKFRLDVWYVDNWSPWLDIRILWMTFAKVFRKEGITAENQATTTEFMGSEN